MDACESCLKECVLLLYNANITKYRQGHFQSNGESIPGLLGFALLRSVIGPENSHHSSQPIRCKTKSNRDLVARVFPRFWQFLFFYFELSLALNHRIISFLLIGRFVINLFLVLRHSIEKRSIIELKIVKLGRQIKRVVVPLSQVWAKETHRYPPPPVEFLRCHSPWAAQILAESRYSTTELQI